MKSTAIVLSLTVLAIAGSAPAAIIGLAGGTAAPSAILGPYTMAPFDPDMRDLYSIVTSVDSPLGGSVDFSNPLEHRRVGMDSGWWTWSHGYLGDVYYTDGLSTITITLPDHTTAFYFYAEPNPFSLYTVEATAQGGPTLSQDINGQGGAAYYGFYSTDGSYISSITVSALQSIDFAIGEFGIARAAVPAPAGILLACLGAGLVGHLRRRKML